MCQVSMEAIVLQLKKKTKKKLLLVYKELSKETASS